MLCFSCARTLVSIRYQGFGEVGFLRECTRHVIVHPVELECFILVFELEIKVQLLFIIYQDLSVGFCWYFQLRTDSGSSMADGEAHISCIL